MSSVPSSAGLQGSKTKTLFLIAVASIGAIIAFSIFRDTIKSEKDFKNRINGKLWSCIPHEVKNRTIEDVLSKNKKGLLIEGNAFISSRYVDSFNRIVAKIEHQRIKDGSKVFVVTSFAENEGKSTISSNIALSLARKGKKVVLMDMDGKKPAIYKLFGCGKDDYSELGMFLSGEAEDKNYKLKRYKKTNLFLAINTHPHANSHKWVEGGVAKKAIRTLRNMVDYIIIDTAPISVDSSVNEFIKVADKTLLVVKTDFVETSTINDAILTITDVGGDLAGCVLNDVHPDMPVLAFTGAGDTDRYHQSKWKLRD
jgi:capsular exopolysaccharide synthesis family protein